METGNSSPTLPDPSEDKKPGTTAIDTAAQRLEHEQRIDKLRQTIKWVVYSLLMVNWGYYIFDDWRVAQHTVAEGASLAEWMNAFATSLDELAWFAMLFLFEAETYWLDDEAMTKLKRLAFVILRFFCYGFLAHTVYAYSFDYQEITHTVLLPAINSACDLVGQDFSFVRNLAYTTIDATTCNVVGAGSSFYQIGDSQVVTDLAGVDEMILLYYIDIQDAIVWLGVVLIIEVVVMLQEKGISEGPLITACNWATFVLYGVLICHALLWAWKGHWVYGWDQLLWIGGFAAIEMNLSEWRDDLIEEAAPT